MSGHITHGSPASRAHRAAGSARQRVVHGDAEPERVVPENPFAQPRSRGRPLRVAVARHDRHVELVAVDGVGALLVADRGEPDLHVGEPAVAPRSSARLMMCGPSRNGMPTRSSPVIRVPAPASVASADRSSTRIRSACSTSARPAGVSVMWLPVRSMSAVPASASSADICWDTADRVYCRRRAAAAMDPSAMTASSMISLRTSSTETSHPLTLHVVDSNSRLLVWPNSRCCSDAMPVTLTEVQRIPTSGARAVEPVRVGGHDLLAIPQLAKDIPGAPPGMNGGDSDTDLLLLNRAGRPLRALGHAAGAGRRGRGVLHASATGRSSRSRASGPAPAPTSSRPRRRSSNGATDGFAPFQEVPTFAAKQWTHWRIGERHFLGLAQGVISRPGSAGQDNQDSVVYEWDGESFAEFQRIPSRWAYNWHAFTGRRRVLRRARRARRPQRPVPLGRHAAAAAADPGRRVRPRVRHLRRRRRDLPRRRLHRRPDPGAAPGGRPSSRRSRCSTASAPGNWR